MGAGAALSIRRRVGALHRWLGTFFCLLFGGWFASGIVMTFAGFPGVSSRERLAQAAPLRASDIRVAQPIPQSERRAFDPAEAPRALPGEMPRLRSLGERPAWVWDGPSGARGIYADDGSSALPLSVALAERVGAAHLRSALCAPAPGSSSSSQSEVCSPTVRPSCVDLVLDEADQWTPQAGRRGHLPLLKLACDDPERSQIYVSLPTGEVVQSTTRRSRMWAWMGAIPHWIYPIALRRHAEAWRLLVLALSAAGSVCTLTGLGLGIRDTRRARRGPLPYRKSALRLHQALGLSMGFWAFTWVFSGMLSLNPLKWSPGSDPTESQSRAFAGGARGVEASATAMRGVTAAGAVDLCTEAWPVKALSLRWVGGTAYWICEGGNDRVAVLAADTAPAQLLPQVPIEDVQRGARATLPGSIESDWATLFAGDTYVYPTHLDPDVPFPLERFRFEDRTWLYVDPRRGLLYRQSTPKTRAERWLFDALHRWDVAFLYDHRARWRGVVISMMLVGMALSFSAARLVWQRRSRAFSRARGERQRVRR